MKKTALISLFIIFVAVGFTVFYLSLKNSGTPAIDARAAYTNNADLATLVHQNAVYRNKIKELQQENRNLQKQLGTPPTDERPATLELTDQATPASTDAVSDVDQHQQSVASAMELTAYFSTFSARSPADIDRDLSNKFAKEDIDYAWASSHEIKLAELFTENEQLTEFVPENISCKTTRCRVTVPTHSHEQSNQIMEKISLALKKNTVGLAQTMVLTIPDPSKGFVDFYIARDSNVRLYQ